MTPQTPSVGRIVHYVSHGTPIREDGSQAYTSECRAAIITAVDQYQEEFGAAGQFIGHVDLCVLNPTGMFFTRSVHQHEGDTGHDHTGAEIPAKSYNGGTWHWPERV